MEQLIDEDLETDVASPVNKVEGKAQAPSALQRDIYHRKENGESTNAVQITGHKIAAYETVALNNNM